MRLRKWHIDIKVAIIGALALILSTTIPVLIQSKDKAPAKNIQKCKEVDYLARFPGEPFVVQKTLFLVNLSNWHLFNEKNADPTSPTAIVTRIDDYIKATNSSQNIEICYGTDGPKIIRHSQNNYMIIPNVDDRAPIEPQFREITSDQVSNKQLKECTIKYDKTYLFTVQAANLPKGTHIHIENDFEFYSFQNPKQETWAANLQYPTLDTEMMIIFPKNKPYISAEIRQKKYDSNHEPEAFASSAIIKAQNSHYLLWHQNFLEPKAKYPMNWTW